MIEDFSDCKEVVFLKSSTWKRVLFHMGGILSLTLVYLIYYWYSLYFTLYDKVMLFNDADTVCVTTTDSVTILITIKEEEFVTNPFFPDQKTNSRYIDFIERKYIYNSNEKQFYPIETIFGNKFEMNKPILIEESYRQGIKEQKIDKIRNTYGLNKLSFPEPSVFKMIIVHLLHPIIVGLIIVSSLCYFSYKYMQTITLMFYVVFIITFQVIEFKSRTKKIKDMSEVNETAMVFRSQLSSKCINLPSFLNFPFYSEITFSSISNGNR